MEVIKRWYSAHRERVNRLGWLLVEASIAASVGLFFATLYLRGQP